MRWTRKARGGGRAAGLAGLAAAAGFLGVAAAQNNLAVYTDSLVNGFQDWSWATVNEANTSPVHSGTDSLGVSFTGLWQGVQLYHPDMNLSSYSAISFWANGGTSGGQALQIYGLKHVGTNLNAGLTPIPLPSLLPANAWRQYTIALSSLGLTGATNFTGFVLQATSQNAVEPGFYLDDIQLIAAPPPALAHLRVSATNVVRTVDARWFAVNTAIWDADLDTPQTISLLGQMGCQALRFPGGSASDGYHWATDNSPPNTWNWASSAASLAHVATNIGAQVVTTVNYGTGSTNEAAAWVAWANGSTTNTHSLGTDSLGTNWATVAYWAALRGAAKLGTDDGRNFLRIGRAAPLGFKYWELGNEVYGTWETDSNAVPNDPYTYAVRARDYISLMKSADPTIHIGAVATPGEDSFVNNNNHAAVNPRTGVTHYGWTPVMLSTLKNLGVTPEFLIHHRYPQNGGGESDEGLLASSTGWAADAADLRQQLTDYLTPTGQGVELVCTENNSVSSNPGKQSTSLVDGLFLADSLGELMQTEFNGLFWWDLRNGVTSTGENNSSTLYGWRLYGDYGLLQNLTNAYPTYYVERLLQNFARGGDTVLAATTDDAFLAAYGVRRQDGALTLMVINKNVAATQAAQIALAGFTPATNATLYSYGIPQDNAAETGTGSLDFAQSPLPGAAALFTNSFPPYSVSVLRFSPAPPVLATLPPATVPGKVVLELRGQPGTPYTLLASTNLVTWTPVATNTATSSVLTFTNPPAGTQLYWRALWQP